MADRSQFCTFYLDEFFFGVEVEKVQEVIRYQNMTPIPLAPDVFQGLINLRGQLVTAIDLRRRLNLPPLETHLRPMNVVLRTDDGLVSLLVDVIGEVLIIDNDQFERPPETLKGVARELIRGEYKLENQLLLVLDINKVLDIAITGYR